MIESAEVRRGLFLERFPREGWPTMTLDQSADRTLTDEDAACLRNAIVDVLHEDFGAELRAG